MNGRLSVMFGSGAAAKIPATLVALLTYAVMAGYFTQSGVILGPAAAALGRSLTDTEPMFAYLLGGNLVGIIVSLVVFDLLTIRQTIAAAYAVMCAGIVLVLATHTFALVCAGIALTGFGGGLGLSTGAVIISKTYAANRRAAAFLVTDCAFSLTGFIIPPLVAGVLTRGWPWGGGYAIVGGFGVLMLAVAIGVRFPAVGKASAAVAARSTAPDAGIIVRVALFAIALGLYLFGQSVFLIWSPSYLQAAFALPAPAAASVVSNFWGPSIFGLIGAALIVTRVAPRIVLLASMLLTTCALVLIATAPSAALFLSLTLAFGCVSTCMYKLMISIGSEQLADAPPRLVTFLLLSGSIGGTLAPLVSAGVVRAFGLHGGPFLALACYAFALVAVAVALVLERTARGLPVTARAAG